MKKNLVCLSLALILSGANAVFAHHCHSHVYLTHKDYYQEELNFHNCNKHYVLKETDVYYYSNGTRRTYTFSTIFNNDGTVLESGCRDVKHHISDGKHYFTFYKNKKYNIMNDEGIITSVKDYKTLEEIAPNKLLVKHNKKYGVIDFKENVIVPLKYKSFKRIGKDIFLTNLNGYYGVVDSSNNTLVKNEYDKISAIHDCFLLKKEGKFGLINSEGEILYKAKCKKIKKKGEYIIVKIGNKYGVLDSGGKVIGDVVYKDIRLNRNTLEGYRSKVWEEIIN